MFDYRRGITAWSRPGLTRPVRLLIRLPALAIRPALLILLALSTHLTPAAHAATRVVSLNLCTDQMLVLLAPQKIAGLSILARDPTLSFVAPQAATLPFVRPSAEAVLRLRPDLVLAGPYGAQTVLGLLEQHGVRVLRLTLPNDFPGIRSFTRSLAAELDAPDRGEALITAMDRTLGEPPARAHPLTAVAWQPRGYTAGPDSLMQSVFQAAALTNASHGKRLALEALVRHPPEILVISGRPAFPSLATDLLDHPSLAAIPRRVVPNALTICAGPFTARAVALLAR